MILWKPRPDEYQLEEIRIRLKDILTDNNLGNATGYGRILRVREVTDKGFDILGGHIGLRYDREHGLIVWNLASRNSKPMVTVEQLQKANEEINEYMDNLEKEFNLKPKTDEEEQ